MSNPIVSVVMGTYNHAHFVAEAIQSVLAQDFTDFEFLIADDGSHDGTDHVVGASGDARISFQAHKTNRGAAIVFNELISRARGRYIAIINSDDAWLPGKLAEQVKILETNQQIGAVFGRAVFVDRHGALIDKSALSFGSVFDQANRSRGEWLRHFFWRGNCLCHPSVLIRNDIYRQVGLYDNRYRQLPDLDMWIRVAKVADLHVSNRDMVRFRVLPGENASSDTDANRIRTWNEHFFIGLSFFDGVGADLLRDGFGDDLRLHSQNDPISLEIEKAFLFLRPVVTLDHVYKLIALLKLRELLASEDHRRVLKQDFGFDDRAWHKLAAETDVFQRVPRPADIRVPTSEIVVDRSVTRDISEVSTRELGFIIRRRLESHLRYLLRR